MALISRQKVLRPTPQGAWAALTLVYAAKYGKEILRENPRTIRLKILELQIEAKRHRYTNPVLFRTFVRSMVEYERICELLECATY